MKVFVQIVDTHSGISQHGMIDEPVQKGLEVANAIGHFGININNVDWYSDFTDKDLHARLLSGVIISTSKVLNVVVIWD